MISRKTLLRNVAGFFFASAKDLKERGFKFLNFLFFFSCSKLALHANGLFTQLLSFNRPVRCPPTICKNSRQRTSSSDSRQKKDVLMNRLFSNYFRLAVFNSLI